MGKVLPFKKPSAKKPSAKQKAEGKTLCRRGFHKWIIDQETQFDVKQGRLVTVHRCQRCDASKTTTS